MRQTRMLLLAIVSLSAVLLTSCSSTNPANADRTEHERGGGEGSGGHY
jgi:hypothetical protein